MTGSGYEAPSGRPGDCVPSPDVDRYRPTPIEMLHEFHTHPNALPETNHPDLRKTLTQEEHDELIVALESLEAASAQLDAGHPVVRQRRRELARELADVLYVAYGTAWVHNIDLDAAFREIHRAAMDKMRAGVRREDGKIVKPPGFIPPNMDGATRFGPLEVREGHSLHEADCPRGHPSPLVDPPCRCPRSDPGPQAPERAVSEPVNSSPSSSSGGGQ